MADSSTFPHGRAILKTVRTSLRLVGGSSELLTVSQLRAVESDLRKTLTVVKGRAQARQPGVFFRNFLESLNLLCVL